MIAQTYMRPKTISDAYDILKYNEKAVVLGGGLFLRLQKREIPVLIDLIELDLDYIKETNDMVSIGAMTTLRTIEKTTCLPRNMQEAVKQISGIGTRNIATIGGSVCGRYPFSDINAALIALDATLVFHNSGEVAIREYNNNGLKTKDILVEIRVPKVMFSRTKYFKKVYTDFSVVNVSVSNHDVVVGARPKRAVCLTNVDYNQSASEILKTVEFGTDLQASGDYRRALAEALLTDIMSEMEGHSGS